MSQIKLYFFPGLGLDENIFKNLDPGPYQAKYFQWFEPLPGESLHQYAQRYSNEISLESTKKILIGHSFGGILAQEISNFSDVECVILISSITSRKELPNPLKMLAKTGLYKIITKNAILKTFPMWRDSYGYHSSELQDTFANGVDSQSDNYLSWALLNLSQWKERKYSARKIIRIHGEKDKTFPVNLIENVDHLIPEGDHQMVFKKPELISQIIRREILKILPEES